MANAKRVVKFDNNRSGALFKYGPGYRGTFELDGVQLDALLTADGRCSLTLKSGKGLIGGFRLPELPRTKDRPVHFTLVEASGARTQMVAFAASNDDHPYFVQLRVDRMTALEQPAGLDTLLDE
jgi:hypothetical protein